MSDLLTSDPRRSSTPMNANAKSRKWRRSTSNAWGAPGSKSQSPLGSPLSNHQTQSAASLFPVSPGLRSPYTEAKKFCPVPQDSTTDSHKHLTISTGDNVVVRRSGSRRTRTRPRSMVVEPVSVREKNSEIAVISRRAESFRTPSPHSDTEVDEENRNVFLAGLGGGTNTNFVDLANIRGGRDLNFVADVVGSEENRKNLLGEGEAGEKSFVISRSPPMSPNRPPPESSPASINVRSTLVKEDNSGTTQREIDIDEQQLQRDLLGGEIEAERVRRVALEIDENVRHLKQQQQQQQQQQLNMSHENVDEEELKDTKELIRLYETGLIGTNGKKLVSSSPPERDVPNTVHAQVRKRKIDRECVSIVWKKITLFCSQNSKFKLN